MGEVGGGRSVRQPIAACRSVTIARRDLSIAENRERYCAKGLKQSSYAPYRCRIIFSVSPVSRIRTLSWASWKIEQCYAKDVLPRCAKIDRMHGPRQFPMLL